MALMIEQSLPGKAAVDSSTNDDLAHSPGSGDVLIPLCVDLDGTLTPSDLLFESLVQLIKRRPLSTLLIPFWLLQGRAALKAQIAERVDVRVQTLPYNEALIKWIEAERASGRSVWLCTAADQELAASVAHHLKLFDGVMASSGNVNLAGVKKAERLVKEFGERGFDYCGNEHRDIEIWKRARGAIVVSSNDGLLREAARHAVVVRTFPRARFSLLSALIRALGFHRWPENLLVLVPLLMFPMTGEVVSIATASLTVIAFCVCDSTVRVAADLFHLNADRDGERSSAGPLAAGELPLVIALVMLPALFLACLSILVSLPREVGLVLGAYSALALAYHLALTSVIAVDVLVYAGLQTLRVIAGAVAIRLSFPVWMLFLTILLFMSLGLAKRVAELTLLKRQLGIGAFSRDRDHDETREIVSWDKRSRPTENSFGTARSRYNVEHLHRLRVCGGGAALASVCGFGWYVVAYEAGASSTRSAAVWLLLAVASCCSVRVWLKAWRGELHEDPLVFAAKDRITIATAVLAALGIIFAVYA